MGPGASPRARTRPPVSLKARALAWLAQRDHSEAEIRRKLSRHLQAVAHAAATTPAGLGEGDGHVLPLPDDHDEADAAPQIDEVIAWLRTRGYLSDERFAESRVHARAARYGNRRIEQELAQHGVALSAQAAQGLRASELERAVAVWRRKFGAPPADAAERARQGRFLAQRGFSPDVVARVMRDAGARAAAAMVDARGPNEDDTA